MLAQVNKTLDTLRHAHYRALAHKYHHYVTATGLTVFFGVTEHWFSMAAAGAWAYAIIESFVGEGPGPGALA